ncbi:MAG: bifunctional folylpolyglutamate synthase/dihydrofolate synthase [Cyanobium sp.]
MSLPLPDPVDLEDLLEPFASRGVDLSLERLRAALADGGHPERRFPAVQVAGTNGKGSICSFLHAILRGAGRRCGTYRSPHLLSWCERLQLDEAWITPKQLRADLRRWRPIGERHALTPFELLTAAAFDRLAASGVELAVLEVGLGGRLDATTAHPQRPVIGFASIGLDHREHLGDTIAAIAREKAGVLSPGSVACSAPQHPEAAAVLQAEAKRLGAELRWVEPLPTPARGGPALGLPGALQRANAAVAVAMVQALIERGWDIPPSAIPAGLAAARWPGRLERRLWRGRPLLLDGAHNPPAAAALRCELDLLDPPPAPRRWLLGIQAHKEGAAMVASLLRPGDRAVVVPIPDHASWSAAALAQACPACAGSLQAAPSPAEGLAWLMAPDGPGDPPACPGPLPVVAGSLYLIGALLPQLDAAGPAS